MPHLMITICIPMSFSGHLSIFLYLDSFKWLTFVFTGPPRFTEKIVKHFVVSAEQPTELTFKVQAHTHTITSCRVTKYPSSQQDDVGELPVEHRLNRECPRLSLRVLRLNFKLENYDNNNSNSAFFISQVQQAAQSPLQLPSKTTAEEPNFRSFHVIHKRLTLRQFRKCLVFSPAQWMLHSLKKLPYRTKQSL